MHPEFSEGTENTKTIHVFLNMQQKDASGGKVSRRVRALWAGDSWAPALSSGTSDMYARPSTK